MSSIPPSTSTFPPKTYRKPPKKWTEKEDLQLKNAVNKCNGKSWVTIALEVEGRNHVQCVHRWKVLRPGLNKGHWTAEEDAILTKLINEKTRFHEGQQKIHFGKIAKEMNVRTSKQCRERWLNHLDPSRAIQIWSKEENDKIIELWNKLEGKWIEIAKHLPGRSSNDVRLQYNLISGKPRKRKSSSSEKPKPQNDLKESPPIEKTEPQNDLKEPPPMKKPKYLTEEPVFQDFYLPSEGLEIHESWYF